MNLSGPLCTESSFFLLPARTQTGESMGSGSSLEVTFCVCVVDLVLAVRIDNFSPLELQAQEQESNPEPGFPQAAGPEDRKTNRPHFSGIEPLQADVEEDNPPRKVDQAEEIIALSGMPITTPNGGGQATTISFMSLKSSPATNQEPTQGRGTSPQPGPMTTTLEQDNQVAKLGVTTNERTPRPSAILLPLDPIPLALPFPML
ncbi:hypothetical protein DSO57_1018658 [Entomophthora muscae]|uniref:Uncharacterized protein n=1 Tax=Entomophthora muscae TaxID=34485 RepID=A0ACC2T4K6_9FUNG|nr:hypothetical protein DSO57_1018658 [Entomophthora muscae]